ncbi:MAG: class IV adenylate cyclase [Candidatus Thorarchaeota archaeon]
MTFEVELKFSIDDIESIEYDLIEEQAELIEIVMQRDHYYNHPTRDFQKTDEAFRIREEGQDCYITYKGPKLDTDSKTRQEIELKIEQFDKMNQLLQLLGFTKVLVVSKERKKYFLRNIVFSLDFVETLGTYLEVEMQCDNDSEIEETKNKIFEEVSKFGLNPQDNIRISYLEMLLEKINK